MFQRTDDLRITQVRPLIPPAILLEEIPITDARQQRRGQHPPGDCRRAGGPRPPAGRRRRARARSTTRRPRSSTPSGCRASPSRYEEPPDCRDAHLFREAADVGRLEGADQRSRISTRASTSTRGSARAQAAARRQRPGTADGLRVSRHADSPAYRRPDRRGWPSARGRPKARCIGSWRRGCRCRWGSRTARTAATQTAVDAVLVGEVAAPVSVGDQAGRLRDLPDDRQRHLSRHPARRQPHRAQLRRRSMSVTSVPSSVRRDCARA